MLDVLNQVNRNLVKKKTRGNLFLDQANNKKLSLNKEKCGFGLI